MRNISKIIGQRIRAYRLRGGLTQEVLAERAEVHPTYIGQIERGEKNVTLVSLEKILTALDVSFCDLFTNINPSASTNTIPNLCYEIIIQMTEAQQHHIYHILKETDEMIKENVRQHYPSDEKKNIDNNKNI